jgi:hypothetical protein
MVMIAGSGLRTVVMPNAALNASAWAPVPVGIEDVAVRAVAHVSFAV